MGAAFAQGIRATVSTPMGVEHGSPQDSGVPAHSVDPYDFKLHLIEVRRSRPATRR